ncbi:MAG: DUF4091 domain-containing protein [Oligosphaeraceae bacterium]
MGESQTLQLRLLDDLQKVFLKPELTAVPRTSRRFTVLQGQRLNFQVAVFSPVRTFQLCQVDSLFREQVVLRQTGMVFSDLPAAPEDPLVLTADPGFFPDPLLPLGAESLLSVPSRKWTSLWVSVDIPRECPSGRHPLRILLSTPSQEQVRLAWPLEPMPPAVMEVELDIIPAELPKQTLWSCSWFHVDCLQHWYGVGFQEPRFWEILEKYVKDMVAHGVNVLFTPLWTPPLDTAIGRERPTCQLLGITEEEGRYRFDFALLEKWITLARQWGMERFEFTHAFSQWGARATPKILVNGKRRFGWDVAATSPEYQDFLNQLLPALARFLRERDLAGKCIFHNSDEPQADSLERYRQSLALMTRHLPDEEFPVVDAMSDVEFVKEGVSQRPIPVTTALDNFQALPLKSRWCYYCGTWQHGAPNRLMGLPSWRNRALGVLLYALGQEGFLHWGHNFWFSQYSLDWDLNPWQNTSAGFGFFGGDSYLVYPGRHDDPVDSLRYEVFAEAMQDYRACQLLESLAGREAVLAILQEGVERPLSMTDYPHSAQWVQDVNQRILQAIDQRI